MCTRALLSSLSPTPATNASATKLRDAAVAAGSWLITGNKKHYPTESFIVTPREYLERTGG